MTNAASSVPVDAQGAGPKAKGPMWVRWLGAILGLILLTGGIGAVLFGEWNPLPPPPDEVVRPVRTAVAEGADARPERRFRGTVLAGRTVDLSFQVGGQLVVADLTLGREVATGELLAKLDETPFQQQIDTLAPQVEQARLNHERISQIVASGAGTPLELANAKAALEIVTAQLAIARRNLNDSTLHAPFPALIVGRSVENFQNISAGTPAVRLQDITHLDIAVDIPENVVALSKAGKDLTLLAEFPVQPDRRYSVQLKEASAEADRQTGTYRAVFKMPSPTDLRVLPGMTVTVIVPARAGTGEGVRVPVEAVFVDARGAMQVWKVVDDDTGAALSVAQSAVSVARIQGEWAILHSGLVTGDEVVTAGTAFLRQGQRVKRLETRR